MRLCVIGPSHLAALRTAEKDGLVDTRGHEISYMGHVAWVFANIRLDGARLFFDIDPPVRPLADDLLAEAKVTDYDALFLHGVIKPASRLVGAASDSLGSYSESMRRKLARGAITRARGFGLLSGLREVFEGPILVSSRPEKAVPPGKTLEDTGNGDLETRNRLLAAALAEHGISYLAQPVQTVLNGQHTRREYSDGSLRLGDRGGHKTKDVLHMNEKYGALVFAQALDLLDAAPGQGEPDAKTADPA